jgi:hypothetical protein
MSKQRPEPHRAHRPASCNFAYELTTALHDRLITARVRVPSENREVVKEMDYEARELAELAADD